MQNSIFNGTGIALVTPFKRDDSIDYRALSDVVEHVIKNKAEYLVALGTTGETPALSEEEQESIVRHIKDINKGRVPLVVGMGGNNTSALLDKMGQWDFSGIDAILTASPHYNKPSQKGIHAHYMAVAEASPLPIIIYNVPSRTGSNITANTLLALASESEKFIGVKEASGDMNQLMAIAAKKPAHFSLISGDDALTLPMISLGGTGVISVIGNAFPRQFSEMVRLALSNKWEDARRIHYGLLEIIEQMFAEGSPSGVKAALNILNICENHVRMPLAPVSRSTYIRLSDLIKAIPI
ncbi:4-hydroxy-tetrahydrodipicolinate synthase [Bacteroidota bacterium]